MQQHTTENLADLANHLHALMAARQTLLLSTISASGAPDISYAPFARAEDGCFYIFVSELAQHTVNLSNNLKASIMLIRPEAESRNLFARERAVFSCRAREITRADPLYEPRLQALHARFGDVVELLRSLPDFHLFALAPENGRYVAGFGKAYAINIGDNTLSPLPPKT